MVSLEFFFIYIILPAALWPLGLTQPLTEMSTRNVSWGVKAAGAYGWQPYHLHVPIVFKSGSLNLLEPSGPVQACNGIALLIAFVYIGCNVTMLHIEICELMQDIQGRWRRNTRTNLWTGRNWNCLSLMLFPQCTNVTVSDKLLIHHFTY